MLAVHCMMIVTEAAMTQHHPELKNPVFVRIIRAIETLEFGEVRVAVHHSKIVSIDRIEKKRIGPELVQSPSE